MAREFPTCGVESFPDGSIRLWIGDTDGANGPALNDRQIQALIDSLGFLMRTRGKWNITWVVPRA